MISSHILETGVKVKKHSLLWKLIMLFLFFTFFFAPLSFASGEKGGKDEWVARDKTLHVSVSCAISILAFNYYKKNTHYSDNQSKTAAFLTTMAVGTAKELTDKKFSWKDMGANALGTGMGLAIKVEF